jgi:hypothetical protein
MPSRPRCALLAVALALPAVVVAILIISVRPAMADSPLHAPDSAVVADTASLQAPVAAADAAADTAVSVTEWAPPPAEIAAVRERVDHPVVRLFVGPDAYDVRGARFDSAGVSFDSGNLRGVPAWDNDGLNGDDTRPAALGSPIGWERIERITMRKPCALRGALVGGLICTAAAAGILGWAAQVDMADKGNPVAVLVLPALGGVVGGAVGAFRWRSEPVWQRAPDSAVVADTASSAGLEKPSTPAPSFGRTGPSAESLALLRTQVGRRAVRVSVGEDDYKLSHARFESSGVVFRPGGRQGMSLWAGEGDSPVSSPIAWDRIDCIRVQRSRAVTGAVTGALLGVWVVIMAANQRDPDAFVGPAFAAGFIVSAPVVGACAGALLGGTVLATWPIAWRPASAEWSVPVADSAGATDASSVQSAAAATPAAPRTPSPAEIATLGERVDHHVARVHLGGSAYDIRGARFESGGVAFAPDALRRVPAWDDGQPDDDLKQPAPPASPISWDRMDKVEVRKPCGTRGALAGGLIGAAAGAAIFAWAYHIDPELGPGILGVFALPPLGVVIGGVIGASVRRSEPVWQRETDRSASAPGAHR